MKSKSTMKRLSFAIAITILLSLSWAGLAQAQKVDTLQGIEISPGIVDKVNNIRYGVAFTGRATGDLPGLFAAAVNYTPSSPGPNITNVIFGGSWAVTVIRNGRIVGTIFGHVANGTAAWDSTGKIAQVQVTLSIKGGTKAYANVTTGTGTFVGTLDHTPLQFKRLPKLQGTLTLNF